MHVAHVIDRLDEIGGVQTYLREVVPALATRGVTGTLLVGRPTDQAAFADAAVVPLPEAQTDGPDLDTSATRALEAGLRETGADVCIVHIAPSPGVARAAAAVCPTVVFAHDYFPACPGNARYLAHAERFCNEGPGLRCFRRAYFERCTNRRPDRLLRATARERAWRRGGWDSVARVVVAAPFVGEVLAADGAPSDRTDVVPYFVGPGRGAAMTSRTDVVFLGRFVRSKGIHVLLEALAQLPAATAVLAGDGPERTQLEALVGRLGLGARVRFAGSLGPAQRDELLAGASVLALPSVWEEPFGIVGLEAMAEGVPVVGSRVGGVPSWLDDGRNGLLVPPGDAGALAEALDRVVSDALFRTHLADGARATATHFSLDHHLALLMQSIDSALSWTPPAGTPRGPQR